MNSEKPPKISVNILNWNRSQDLEELLKSLKKQTVKDFEVIVVDNNSSDDSQIMVSRKFPTVKLVRLQNNLGVAGGRNAGILSSLADILVFVDNDATLDDNGLQALLERFELAQQRGENLGIIGFKVVNYFTGEHQKKGWTFSADKFNSKEEFKAFVFPGGACAIRKTVFETVGLFADHYYFGTEEEDLAIRAIEKGFKIIYFPFVRLHHKVSPVSRLEPSRQQYYYYIRNQIWMYFSYFSIPRCARFVAAVIRYNFFKTLKNRSFLWFVAGFIAGISYLPMIFVKYRRKIGIKYEKNYFLLRKENKRV